MRRLALAAALLAPLACSSIDQFDIPLSVEGVLPGRLSHLPQNGFPPYDAGGDISQKIDNQGVKASDIATAKLTKGTVTVTAPEGGHLAYLDSLEIRIRAEGLDEKRIAHQDVAFKERRQSYDLVLDDVELKPYLAAKSLTLTPTIQSNSTPSQDVNLRIDLTLHVDLTLVN